MFKKLLLKIVMDMIDRYAEQAESTPDPMDDMIAALLKQMVSAMMTAKSAGELLSGIDSARATFKTKHNL